MTTILHQFRVILMVFIALGTITLSAQNNMETADKQFELQAYDLALESYTQLLNDNPACLDCQLKIAESFRIIQKPTKSIAAYEKAMLIGSLEGEYLLGYGHALKTLGRYSEAKVVYNEFSISNPLIGSHFAKSCDLALSNIDNGLNYSVNSFDFNTVQADKALTFHNGNLILISYMPSKLSSHTADWLKTEGDLLSVKGDMTTSPVLVRDDFEENGDVNAISYTADNSLCILSKTSNVTHLKPVFDNESSKSLFLSNEIDENSSFHNEVPFIHNETGSSTTHPSLSKDGLTLYFTSNREGGFGGFDIYISNFVGGTWSIPVNLGSTVNTSGNEITPALSIDGSLLFASDYHSGYGGYDVFSTEKENGEWTSVKNLGSAVNSSYDDYMPLLDFAGELKYITSNRLSTQGGSDIFEINSVFSQELVVNIEEEDLEELMIDESDLNEEPKLEPIFVMTEQTQFEIRELESLDLIDGIDIYVADALEMPKAYVIPEYRSSGFDRDPNLRSVSLANGEKIPANAYFVQLASISKVNANFSVFKNASTLGNVYKIFKNNLVKIRVGYYGDRTEAAKVLEQVKRKGYSDAFITNDNLNMGAIELIYSTFDNNFIGNNEVAPTNTSPSYDTDTYNASNNASNYKVRLAAYDNPLFFDVAAVKGIAKLEQWSKGDWTIFLLGGFNTLEEAERAKIKAINRGFIDAYLVVDNGGVLEKLTKN